MSKVFVGGSRHVSRLHAEVRHRLDRIVEQQLPVVVGDANGADRAVQAYLHTVGYRAVEVFCAGGRCRNNVGGWPVRVVEARPGARGFSFYATKDREMTAEADYGFMLWDGKSKGTLLNVLRLVRQGKQVVVYNSAIGKFAELRSAADWDAFAPTCPAEVLTEAERAALAESQVQPSLI